MAKKKAVAKKASKSELRWLQDTYRNQSQPAIKLILQQATNRAGVERVAVALGWPLAAVVAVVGLTIEKD